MEIGSIVMVARDNDNEAYDSFRDKELIITRASYSVEDHLGYDESMEGMGLFDLETVDGEEIHVSLYEYELEEV